MSANQFSIFLFISLMSSVFAIIALSAIMFGENRTMVLQHQIRLTALESENRAAHIKALQAQIDPHFMHNTLSTIVALVKLKRSTDALQCMQAFSGMLRYKYRASNLVSLEEELDYVRNYLIIQSLRYGDRFSVDWNVDWNHSGFLLPALSIQPLVENALEHAWNGDAPVQIRITIQSVNGELQIEVYDNGIGIDQTVLTELTEWMETSPTRWSEEHVGLFNVHHRLQLMFGSSYGLTIKRPDSGGTLARLSLPAREVP